MPNSFRWYAILTAALLVGGLTSSRESVADDLDIDRLQSQIYAAVDSVLPAVVAIRDRGRYGGSIFSGVIVSEDGIVLSAGHAVTPNRSYTVMLPDGRRLRAKGLGVNERVDIAMLKIDNPESLPVAAMGHSAAVVRNQPVIGVSYPGMYDAQRGAVIRFGYVNQPITTNEGMIESTAMMEPGDSGGPLIDIDGKVIGIHSNIRRTATKNYDVPIDSFRQYWEQLKTPERFDISGWPSLPKLGFRASEIDDRNGMLVTKIFPDGLAKPAGLLPGDIVTEVAGERVNTVSQFRSRFLKLRTRGETELQLSVQRGDKHQRLKLDLTNREHPTPASYSQLRDLAKEFSSLESRLDDVEFVVQSRIGNKLTRVRGTRIYRPGTGVLVSKSTRVGEQPKIELANGLLIEAKVVARDSSNDLVLLSAKLPGPGGIDLSSVVGDLEEKRGKLLLIPDSQGPGTVSIWGSRYFHSPRTVVSGGFLGVIIGTNSGNVTFDEVLDGAARKAGVRPGDVLIRMDNTLVTRRSDVNAFLSKKDPNSKIKLLIKRDEQEMTKEVLLGSRPSDTGHIADDLIGGKSQRRDGFSLVVSHDADLGAAKCGGPVFDIEGNFLGINIARASRTRCYVIPKTILKQFVDAN